MSFRKTLCDLIINVCQVKACCEGGKALPEHLLKSLSFLFFDWLNEKL